MEKSEIDNRFSYHAPKGDQQARYEALRARGKNFAELINGYCPDSRERSIALTKLDEVVMWANASIARREE